MVLVTGPFASQCNVAGLGEVTGTELEAMISELRDLEATMALKPWRWCPPNGCFNGENHGNIWETLGKYGTMVIFTN